MMLYMNYGVKQSFCTSNDTIVVLIQTLTSAEVRHVYTERVETSHQTCTRVVVTPATVVATAKKVCPTLVN